MSKDAYYFPHDSNAKTDPSMLLCRAKYGAAGYGNYFMIVEMLREEDGYRLRISKHVYVSIGLGLGIQPGEAESLIDDLVNEYNLLSRDKNFIWSESLLRRMKKLEDLRAKRSIAGRKGAKSKWQNHSKGDGKPHGKPHGKSMAGDLPTHLPNMNDGTFKPPALKEIQAYCRERKNEVNPEAFMAHYESVGWKKGRSRVTDWKACVVTWETGDVSKVALRGADGAAQSKKDGKIRNRQAKKCVVCDTAQREPFSIVCKKDAWCRVCDKTDKDSNKDPKTLKVNPDGHGVVCPKHSKAVAGKLEDL